ncbi:MAG: hypothetical protein ACXVHL_32340, partial [Solirubrobacteraceae bacterium]
MRGTAVDDQLLSPGSGSKYRAGHLVYSSPRSDPRAFRAELERASGARDRRDPAALSGDRSAHGLTPDSAPAAAADQSVRNPRLTERG